RPWQRWCGSVERRVPGTPDPDRSRSRTRRAARHRKNEGGPGCTNLSGRPSSPPRCSRCGWRCSRCRCSRGSGLPRPGAINTRPGGAAWRHRLGHVPLWSPELFGGLPFVAAGHGDIFYPTSFLRLVLPVETVVNLGFVLHYILAGLFTYWLLRRLHVSWTGSVIGGLAYELSGLIASYPSPGHDGKLFASAALPLACLALLMA